jgi:hypothetical protein
VGPIFVTLLAAMCCIYGTRQGRKSEFVQLRVRQKVREKWATALRELRENFSLVVFFFFCIWCIGFFSLSDFV